MENFEQLLAQYEPMIYKIIGSLNIYKNQKDFYQLGLIGLWEASNRFDPTKGNFTNYAYTYMKGLFLTEISKSKKYGERNVHTDNDFWDLIEDCRSDQPLEENLLLPLCKSLTESQKKWLLYTCVDDLTIKEIAKIEKVSPSTVKNWRAGAREKLKPLIVK